MAGLAALHHPDGRAAFRARLDAIVEQRGWQFLKFRHLRRLAREVAEILGLEALELDGIRHARGWDSTDWPTFRERLRAWLDHEYRLVSRSLLDGVVVSLYDRQQEPGDE